MKRCQAASTRFAWATSSIPDASTFSGPREFAAFLGLTPRQSSSGGKELARPERFRTSHPQIRSLVVIFLLRVMGISLDY